MRKIKYRLFFIITIFLWSNVLPAADISKQVVRIIVHKQENDYFSPWKKKSIQETSLGGFIAENNYIVTYTYSLTDSVLIHVLKNGSLKRYPADIVIRDYHSGFTLLKAKDKEFYKDLTPVTIGEKQSLIGKKAAIYRWSDQGNFRKYTGDVINTMIRLYKPHCGAIMHDLSTSMDTGGYGEPVFYRDRLVGLSTGFDGNDKKLYVLGADGFRRMMKDLKDGKFQGTPLFWIEGTAMVGKKNLREYLGLSEKDTGIYIDNIHPTSSGSNVLKGGDILLSVNGTSIDDRGMYLSRHYGKLNFLGLFYLDKYVNDTVSVSIMRNKKGLSLSFPLNPVQMDKIVVPLLPYDKQPEYLIYGGLIFQHLSIGYLKTWGTAWKKTANKRLLINYHDNIMKKYENGKRIIVLSRILPSSINRGYQNLENLILDKINGRKVKNLKELGKILKSNRSKYIKFDFTGNNSIILNRKAVQKYKKNILRQYNISTDSYIRH